MKFKLLNLFIGAALFSSASYAETIPEHISIKVADVTTLNIEDIVQIKNRGANGIEDLIKLGDFYSYNEKYRDTFEAYVHYQAAARQGSEYAKMMLGYMTYKGYGTTKNPFKGEHLLKEVKKPYDKNALYLLSLNYLDDGKDEKAISLLKTIKDPQSYTYLTKELITQRRFDEAIPYLEWLIDEENSNYGKRELALILLKPDFNKEERAIELLTSAALAGDSESQYKLGYYFHKGTLNTKADFHKAVQWYTTASQNGSVFAKQELLKIWNDNQANNNKYKLDNDPYLLKLVQDSYAKEMNN